VKTSTEVSEELTEGVTVNKRRVDKHPRLKVAVAPVPVYIRRQESEGSTTGYYEAGLMDVATARAVMAL
jgi:hypothetical protein